MNERDLKSLQERIEAEIDRKLTAEELRLLALSQHLFDELPALPEEDSRRSLSN